MLSLMKMRHGGWDGGFVLMRLWLDIMDMEPWGVGMVEVGGQQVAMVVIGRKWKSLW